MDMFKLILNFKISLFYEEKISKYTKSEIIY